MADERALAERWTEPSRVLERYSAARLRRLADTPGIYSYRRPPIGYDYPAERLPLAGARVLDAGCGTGGYLPHFAPRVGDAGRLVGCDFSADALREARRLEVAPLVRADVQRLPFRDAAFDLVASAHMLYHVPDIEAAIREFHRVLRAGGLLAIIVGSERDQAALDDLFVAAGGAFPLARYSDRFTADNAPAYVQGLFPRVEREAVTPDLVIDDPEVLVAHFEGERHLAEPSLRDDVPWDLFLENVRRLAAGAIAEEGAVRIPEEIVMLRCYRD